MYFKTTPTSEILKFTHLFLRIVPSVQLPHCVLLIVMPFQPLPKYRRGCGDVFRLYKCRCGLLSLPQTLLILLTEQLFPSAHSFIYPQVQALAQLLIPHPPISEIACQLGHEDQLLFPSCPVGAGQTFTHNTLLL